jgi:hypothetical protein
MEGLDYLGAAETLSSQYITFRVKSIDAEKLKNKLGGSTGQLASSGLTFINLAPEATLDIAVPLIVKQAKEYGVDAEVTVSRVPPSKGGRSTSEFFPGLFIGLGIGGSILAIVKLVMRLAGR